MGPALIERIPACLERRPSASAAPGSGKDFARKVEEGLSMATATALGLEGTLLFHLNLNHGSIEVAGRGAVVTRCYRPLLELAEARPWLRLAIAASGHTLERIARADPAWIPRLCALLEAGRVEFIGTGDTLLIGPLVPAAVNRWNQGLGRATYLRLLARAPRIALVNAFAWSQGLLDAYLDAGYEALIMEWNDPRRTHPEWQEEWRHRTAWTQSPSGRRIRILWTEANLQQGFQHAATGELESARYVDRVLARGGSRARHAFLYAGEAELFDHRPGSAEVAQGEWPRIVALCEALHERGLEFTTPQHVLADARFEPTATLELSTASNPIPLAHEPRCSVTRWALSGWEDVGLNARCFARAKELQRVGGSPHDWQLLCRAWGADLRAHLTEKRWRRLAQSLPAVHASKPSATAFLEGPLRSRRVEWAGSRLAVGTDGVRAVLNLRRGLALDSLVLRHAGPEPLLGTLQQEPFDDAGWEGLAAHDLFSGHTVLEVPGAARVTDLAPVEPEVEELAHCVSVRARVPTARGPLPKEVRVYAHRLELCYGFSAWGKRPRASLRTGALTLLDGALGDELWVSCANGGPRERMRLAPDFDHARGDPQRGSACAAFGASDGWIAIDDGRIGFEVSWPQEEAAALPLVTCLHLGERRLVRLQFTLAELDEACRPGAPLHDFRLSVRPYRNRR